MTVLFLQICNGIQLPLIFTDERFLQNVKNILSNRWNGRLQWNFFFSQNKPLKMRIPKCILCLYTQRNNESTLSIQMNFSFDILPRSQCLGCWDGDVNVT